MLGHCERREARLPHLLHGRQQGVAARHRHQEFHQQRDLNLSNW